MHFLWIEDNHRASADLRSPCSVKDGALPAPDRAY